MTEQLDADAINRKIWGLHPNVFFMGLTSLLTDISSEMVFTLIPVFLQNVLGASGTIVGFIGGFSEGADALFRILSGWFSDRIGKRKILAVWGYSISTVAKPFLSLANVWGAVMAIRFTDRLGKGVRTSSRDALIADSIESGERGRAFGLHRAMDTTGAFLGLIIAAVVVYLVQGTGTVELKREVFQGLALYCVIPGVLAVILLQIFVREKKREKPPSGISRLPLSGIKGGGFGTRFWMLLGILAVFSLGHMPHNYFVILRAQDLGAPLLTLLGMVILFNAVYAASSLPMGILSDKLGRRRILAVGWFIYAVIYIGFALSSTMWHLWLAFACLGVYFAIIEGVSRAFVADLAPEEKRGTAFGLYHGVVGICVVLGGLIGGVLWDVVGPAGPFYYGAGLSLVAMIAIMTLVRE